MPKSKNVFAINSPTTFYHRLGGGKCVDWNTVVKIWSVFAIYIQKGLFRMSTVCWKRQFTHLLMQVSRINRLSNYAAIKGTLYALSGIFMRVVARRVSFVCRYVKRDREKTSRWVISFPINGDGWQIDWLIGFNAYHVIVP